MRFLFIILLLTISLGAFAQANLMQIDSNAKKSDNFLDNLSTFITLSGSTDLKEASDETKSYSSLASLLMNYTLDSDDSLRFDVSMAKDLQNNYEETLNDARISHTRVGIFRAKNYTLSYRSSLRIPLSDRSIKRDRVKTAIELNLLNSFNLNDYVKGLSFTYIPRYRRFFNEFETDINGANLVEQNLINILVLGYQATDRLSLSSTFVYIYSRDYTGADRPQTYGTTQDITYSINKTASASVGIETGGAIRNFERGTDTSVEIFDKDTTSFYTGLNLAF
jgi:hypothetical protein